MAFDYSESDSSYDEGPAISGERCGNARRSMNLRKTSRLRRPVRYRNDSEPIDPGRPAFVHQDPVFNKDRARFVQWRSLELDEPSPGEALYNRWQEQGEPRDAFGGPVTPSRSPVHQVSESPPGPTVAHLRRQSIAVRPDLSQPVFESIEHRDEFDKAFEENLAALRGGSTPQTDGADESLQVPPQLNSKCQDWSSLSDKVKWAIIYDLANAHEDGISTAADLLGLTLDDVIDFVNLYVREKTLWENGAYQEEPVRPVGELLKLRGEEHEVGQPAPEAAADQFMRDDVPDWGDLEVRAIRTAMDDEVTLPIPEGTQPKVSHEPEAERSQKTNTQVVAEEEAGQLVAEHSADQPGGGQAGDEELDSVASVARRRPVDLITDSFSREDVGSGRSFLTFVGLHEYADRFGGWFGSGTWFREIPGIFDENNEFIFSTEDTEKALYSGNELAWKDEDASLQGTSGGKSDDGQRLFNMSLVMQPGPPVPEINHGIAPRFPDLPQVGINEGYGRHESVSKTYPPSSPQLPSSLAPRDGIAPPAGKVIPAFASLGHNSNDVASSDQASQSRARGSSNATPKLSQHLPIETSLKPDAPSTAEKDMHDARVVVGPASGEADSSAAQSNAQGTAESGQFSEKGIAVDTFPKCSSCFRVRARCDGGRPCKTCVTRSRTCKAVTKADLDKFPDRAERVLKDKAKANGNEARAEGPSVVRDTTPAPNAAVSALAASDTATPGTKRKQPAMTRLASTDEDESDLDRFPPEKEDPTDGDYGLAPKKPQKKGKTPVGKKQTASPAKPGVPATPTPTKKRRGPYKKKNDTSTPKRNEPAVGAKTTSAPQSGRSASAGNAATAKSGQKTSAKASAAIKDKLSISSLTADEGNVLRGGAGRSVNDDAAQVVRHAGDKFGMTNVRPASVGKREETPKLAETRGTLDSSLSSLSPSSGARDFRYLNIPFAPASPQPYMPMSRLVSGVPVTQVPRSLAGTPNASLHPAPSQRSYPVPISQNHLIPPRAQGVATQGYHPGGAELARTASNLNMASMALQGTHPMATNRVPLVPQVDRPGLNGSPGATDISPASRSDSSGMTANMDFLQMPFNPAQGSPAHPDGVMPRSRPQSNSGHQSMMGFLPNSAAGMMPVNSPTASQRRPSVSSYNHGAPIPGTSVPSPMMGMNSGFARAPGVIPPYGMLQQQWPIPRPISGVQHGPAYPVPQQMMHPPMPSGVLHGPRGEEMPPGSRGASASPAGQQHTTAPSRPAKRQADAQVSPGQQPARKKPKALISPLAPPREARSWKDLARSQWATETQDNQPGTANFSVNPAFGSDGPFDVSSSQITSTREQIDPELQQTTIAEADKTNKSPAGPSEGAADHGTESG